jgi:cysteinyl-tRNA synthetase
MMVLNSYYRSPLTFNDEVVAQAERALERLRTAVRPVSSERGVKSQADASELRKQMELSQKRFISAMDDDFNTAGALGQMFDLARSINQAKDADIDPTEIRVAQGLLVELGGVLGLRLEQVRVGEEKADKFVDLLIEIRGELRQQKQWAMSDSIRDRLLELGVLLEDGKDGTTWRWQ